MPCDIIGLASLNSASYPFSMMRRWITLGILAIAWAFLAPAAFAHDHSTLAMHDHHSHSANYSTNSSDHHRSKSAFAISAIQSLCLDCTSDHDQTHDCDCCFPGNHHYMCQPLAGAMDLRGSTPMARLISSWQVPDGRNPSGLERPPKI